MNSSLLPKRRTANEEENQVSQLPICSETVPVKKQKSNDLLHDDLLQKNLETETIKDGLMVSASNDKNPVERNEDEFNKVEIEVEKCNALDEVALEVHLTKTKKKKAKLLDKTSVDVSSSDPLQEGTVENNAVESTEIQKEVGKCNVSEKAKLGVSLTDCKERSPSLRPGDGEDISSADYGDKEFASAGKDMKDMELTTSEYLCQKNVHGLTNLPCMLSDGHPIAVKNLELSSTDCHKEAKDFIENGVNKEDKLLMVSVSPERTLVECVRRKLLILDLNGLLIDTVDDLFQSNTRKADVRVGGKSVYKRPFCDDFLKFCIEQFDVGVWSSRKGRNVDSVVNFLMGDDKEKLLFCWDQSKCTFTGFNTIENRSKPLFLKELKKLWDKEDPNLPWEKGHYTPSNTLLLDDSPYKALANPEYTAIFPQPYSFKDESDTSLGPGGDLRIYLEALADSHDVRCYVKEHPFGQRAITSANPSWRYYLKVKEALNSSVPAL